MGIARKASRVTETTRSKWLRRTRRAAIVVSTLAVAWIVFAEVTLLRPPRDLPPAPPHSLVRDTDGTRHFGRSYMRRHGGVWEMALYGDPVELGDAHAHLIRDVMFHVEGEMMKLFAYYVPSAALRSFITTLVRAQHWHLDRNYPHDRLFEMAAEARALAENDPFADFLPTYHRVLTLHALYDISLSFEHSPLIGCTALFASGEHTADGHTYVGRNFDMEIDPVFDTDKTVVLFHPRNGIPFASVAWPGLTGVVTGMNREGIFVAVHGGRASSASTHGVPVPTTVRTVLEHAHTLDEAVALVRADAPMVSHILIVVDGDRGEGVAIERAPDREPFVRPLGSMGGISNHYAAPYLASDPKNLSVRDHTSSIARQHRVDELLAANDHRFDPSVMLGVLRDRRGASDHEEPLGHRGTMDAWIATHSVVADATDRVLWVSAGPHTLGRYERFDLRAMLSDEYRPGNDVDTGVLPADPSFQNGLYQRWVAARGEIERAESRVGHHDPRTALTLLDAADARIAPEHDMDSLRIRARALTDLHQRDAAIGAWRTYLQADPPSPAEARAARDALHELGAVP